MSVYSQLYRPEYFQGKERLFSEGVFFARLKSAPKGTVKNLRAAPDRFHHWRGDVFWARDFAGC